jgi:hypothetical protein
MWDCCVWYRIWCRNWIKWISGHSQWLILTKFALRQIRQANCGPFKVAGSSGPPPGRISVKDLKQFTEHACMQSNSPFILSKIPIDYPDASRSKYRDITSNPLWNCEFCSKERRLPASWPFNIELGDVCSQRSHSNAFVRSQGSIQRFYKKSWKDSWMKTV